MGICKMHHSPMGDGRLCSPAISPPICPPNLVPIPHESYNLSHSPPLIHSHLPIPHLSIFHSFLLHTPSTLPFCHPLPTSFLPPSSSLSIPFPIPYPTPPVSLPPSLPP